MADNYAAPSWSETFLLIWSRPVLNILLLGFSAGLPYLLIFSSLSLWLKEAGVERSTIGFLSWAALSYSFKFVWAPLIDKLPLPILSRLMGRRRSWLLCSQLGIIVAILIMAFSEPSDYLAVTVTGAILLGFAAATQDIVIDAYRIESAKKSMQSILSSAYIAGYRGGMLIGGAGALYVADWLGGDVYTPLAWTVAYAVMAVAMLIGVATTFGLTEPKSYRPENSAFASAENNLRFVMAFLLCVGVFVAVFALSADVASVLKSQLLQVFNNKALAGVLVECLRLFSALFLVYAIAKMLVKLSVVPGDMLNEGYIAPIADFFTRFGKKALLIIGLIAIYRIADIVMGVIANLFYSDLGFSKSDIATVSKVYGLLATLLGGFVGGALAIRYGIYRALLLGAILSAATNVIFAIMASSGGDISFLMLAITADNLSGGIATAAFIAYLSSLTSISFTAMQYAIFSSMMTLIPKLLAGYSGAMSLSLGYQNFFYLTAIMGVPAVFLVLWLSRVLPIEVAVNNRELGS